LALEPRAHTPDIGIGLLGRRLGDGSEREDEQTKNYT
jgi:hypothetical protein